MFNKAGRKGLKDTKANCYNAKDDIRRFKQQRAEQSLRKQASQNTNSAIKALEKSEKTIKQSATSADRKQLNLPKKKPLKLHRNP